MNRFHINSCIVFSNTKIIKNNIIIDSLKHLKDIVNMDIYLNSRTLETEIKDIMDKNVNINFYDNLDHLSDILKDYDTYIEIQLNNFFIHSHLPQFINYNLHQNKFNLKNCYYFNSNILYLKDNNILESTKNKKIYFSFSKENCIKILKYKSKLIKFNSTNKFGLFKIEKNYNNTLNYNQIMSRFYKKFIYKTNYIDKNPIFMIENLKNQKPFTYIRIGDGEQHCIQSQFSNSFNSHNKNGCSFNTEGLAKSIMDILNDDSFINKDNIYIAWNPSPIRNRFDCYYAFDQKFNNFNMTFLEDHTALIRKLLYDPDFIKNFLNEINKRKYKLYVGPKYMNDKYKAPIKFDKFIEIPEKDCFSKQNDIYNEITKYIDNNSNSIVFFSGGLGIKSTIHKLYKNFGDKHTFFDIGSVLDPFYNKWTRNIFTKNANEIVKNYNVFGFISNISKEIVEIGIEKSREHYELDFEKFKRKLKVDLLDLYYLYGKSKKYSKSYTHVEFKSIYDLLTDMIEKSRDTKEKEIYQKFLEYHKLFVNINDNKET